MMSGDDMHTYQLSLCTVLLCGGYTNQHLSVASDDLRQARSTLTAGMPSSVWAAACLGMYKLRL